MDNFKLNQEALELSATQTSYKLAKELLLTKEEFAKLSDKYALLNEIFEETLVAHKVLRVAYENDYGDKSLDDEKLNNLSLIHI